MASDNRRERYAAAIMRAVSDDMSWGLPEDAAADAAMAVADEELSELREEYDEYSKWTQRLVSILAADSTGRQYLEGFLAELTEARDVD
ncbi:hypothetical protein ACQEU8_02400 [Streptomyces sp. CA-250714]|uniref:hypothetical protein n=1 Tax=Streptomyces sp. CA-250714 TaxID=3240060 RepID=UPI003D942434